MEEIDEELERLKQKKLQDLVKKQNELKTLKEIAVIDLTESNFEKVISNETPTLVDFWADWCGPCKVMHPVFERLSRKYNQIKFARVNVDQNQSIAMRYSVQAIPTFIMFKNGQEVDRMMGAVGEPGIHMIAKKHLRN